MPTEELVALARTGDEEAWQQLVDRHYPLVCHWCLRNGVRGEQVHDLVQEVFLAVFRSLSGFESGHDGGFVAWLSGVSRHKLADRFRKEGHEPNGVGGTDGLERMHQVAAPTETSTGGYQPELPPPVAQAIGSVQAEFEAKTWLAFWQTTIEGQTPIEVAGQLGMSTNAVYLARSRVLRRLREELGPFAPGEEK